MCTAAWQLNEDLKTERFFEVLRTHGKALVAMVPDLRDGFLITAACQDAKLARELEEAAAEVHRRRAAGVDSVEGETDEDEDEDGDEEEDEDDKD